MPRKEFETPAPGEYDIDRLDKSKLQCGGCIRGYTFGHPNSQSRPSRQPGNNTFMVKSENRISFSHCAHKMEWFEKKNNQSPIYFEFKIDIAG